jgi:uncharacterized protein
MKSAAEPSPGRLDRFASRLAQHIARAHVGYVALFAVLTALSVYFVTRLELKSDFIELLPQDYQSVRDLRQIIAKVGGLGNLSVAFESADVKASEHIADDLAAVLDRDFKDRIRFYEYKVDRIKAFYTDNAALYASLDDLQEIRDRIKQRVRQEERKRVALFTDLDDEAPADNSAAINFDDIKAKYEAKNSRFSKYIDGYMTGEDGRLLVMMIKPLGSSTSIPQMDKLVHDVDAAIKKLGPQKYAADLHYGFAGSYKIGLEEYETLKSDILGTALLCVGLISLAIFAFFRRLRAGFVLGVSCAAAVMWTFAATYFAIGYLNTVTAFLGAIIAGTGINYGIILLARYFEERRLGVQPAAALETAIRQTWVATLGAAGTTAVAFGIFMMAQVKSFSQFGFIGGIGILFMWVGSYSLLPAIIILSERIWPSVSQPGRLLGDEIKLGLFSTVSRHRRLVLAVFAGAAVLSAAVFAHYLPESLEYNMSRLRTKSSMESGTAKLDHRISQILGMSTTPAVLLSGTPERGRAICEALQKKKTEEGDAAGIERCRSLTSLLPDEQSEKLTTIGEIKRLLTGKALASLNDEQRRQAEDLIKSSPERALTFADLPETLTRPFVDKEGNLGTFVYVDPRAGRNLWNSTNLMRFTNDIREITLSSGEVVTSSGEAVIFADLLKLMKHDSPLSTALSFAAVVLVVWLVFRRLRPALMVAGALLVGSLLMVGGMAAADIKLNFFNFVALPMTFGIGVDYAINIYQRYVQEGRGSMDKVLRRTGPAVFLCSLTTIIGYFTLIIADSNALVSLGGLAIMGEFTCLGTAMIALPALVASLESRASRE